MHEHGPNSLEGPVRGSPTWWRGMQALDAAREAGPSKPTRKKCRKQDAQEDKHIRKELVERVRREIEAGTYDTPEKWDAALDRLLERMNGD